MGKTACPTSQKAVHFGMKHVTSYNALLYCLSEALLPDSLQGNITELVRLSRSSWPYSFLRSLGMWNVQNCCRVHLCKGEWRVLYSPLSSRHGHSCPSPPPAPTSSNFCRRLNDHTIVLPPVTYHLSLGLCSVYSVSLLDVPHLLV